jgi:hypothetical protein
MIRTVYVTQLGGIIKSLEDALWDLYGNLFVGEAAAVRENWSSLGRLCADVSLESLFPFC